MDEERDLEEIVVLETLPAEPPPTNKPPRSSYHCLDYLGLAAFILLMVTLLLLYIFFGKVLGLITGMFVVAIIVLLLGYSW